MDTTMSFPGLGIGEFTVDRVAFSLFGKDVYWYGILITLGIVFAFVHAYLRSRQESGITLDDLLDVAIWLVLLGVVGARLYYVAFDYPARPENYKNFIDVIAIWDGGGAIYGALIFGALSIVGVTLYKKLNTLQVMDTIAPGVMVAQAIGRWGNFFNGEAHGGVVSENSPLYFLRMGLYEGGRMQYFHPTFFYEGAWNVLGFILISIFYRKKKFNGQIVMAYVAWYGLGRMFIEGLRTDSLMLGPIRISQLIGALCFLAGAGFMTLCWILTARGKAPKFLHLNWAKPAIANGAPEATEESTEANESTEIAEETEPAQDEKPNESEEN